VTPADAWDAYLKEAEDVWLAAVDELRAIPPYDINIITAIPQARERCRVAEQRFTERGVAYAAYKAAHRV
jgi:hypothetical protein